MEAKREIIVIVILVTISLILWFINSYLATQLYINSLSNVNIDEEVVILRQQNMELRNKLLQLESYTRIEQQARKQGFISGQSVVY